MDELQAGVEQSLAVLPQSAVLFQPHKAAFDDPALGHDLETVQLPSSGRQPCGGAVRRIGQAETVATCHFACNEDGSVPFNIQYFVQKGNWCPVKCTIVDRRTSIDS